MKSIIKFVFHKSCVLVLICFGVRAVNSLFFFSRVVSQIEYPSLVDLRGLLLDLVAQLLGALSRIR